jgi:hypothetical protein
MFEFRAAVTSGIIDPSSHMALKDNPRISNLVLCESAAAIAIVHLSLSLLLAMFRN